MLFSVKDRACRAIVFSIATAVATTAMQAATLEPISGIIRVNTGDGFRQIQDSARVRPGDTVMLDVKSKARLEFADGCSVPMTSAALFVIPEVSPCSMNAQLGATPPPAPATGLADFVAANPGVALGGAALAAGAAAGAAVAGSNSGRNNNSSTLNAAALLAQQQRPATP